MARDSQVLFDWQVSSFFGWGIYGLNLMQAWADRPDLLPISLQPQGKVVLDPLESLRIEPALNRSIKLQTELKALPGGVYNSSSIVLQGMGNDLQRMPVLNRMLLDGSPSVGIVFMEKTTLTPEAAARLRELPLVIAGSSWNQKLLQDAGAPRVELVLQGIDTSQFHPAPKRGLFKGRFVVFSGGKLEQRKGQDLVLRAFRIFAQRHKDALLLTAWGSPWPDLARNMGAEDGMIPPPFLADGQFNAHGWTRNNGVPDEQVFHCGSIANYLMPRILREADVAIFSNRAEGGTNLVAMECMASGVPVILSDNTGHRDLLEDGTAVALRHQSRLPSEDMVGWGNSDIEEMVAALETIYNAREEAQARALRGAASISRLTWTAQMNKLGELLLPLLPNM
jgi:glycosyltransferase involved in cell wall biosynthesis